MLVVSCCCDIPLSLSRAAATAECVSAMDGVRIAVGLSDDESSIVTSGSGALSSFANRSIALSTPSGNQYSAQAHNVFPSGDTSKPPSLYNNARGTKVRGCKTSNKKQQQKTVRGYAPFSQTILLHYSTTTHVHSKSPSAWTEYPEASPREVPVPLPNQNPTSADKNSFPPVVAVSDLHWSD
jgi:hypothetical protein